MLESQTALGIGNDSYIRGMLEKALGDKAGSVIDRILMGSASNGLESMKWMDPKAIAEIIRLEHPQIVAIVLSYLEADSAARVLTHLPEDSRAGILMRIATLEGVQPAAIKIWSVVHRLAMKGTKGRNRMIFASSSRRPMPLMQ